jgi:hypothetical protein
MADISQGNRAELILTPGDVYRVSTGGTATVEAVYGAPAGTTTVTASTKDFGPYAANAKLIVRAVTGSCSYGINQAVQLMARSGSLDDASRAALGNSGFVGSIQPAGMVRARMVNNVGFSAIDTSSFRQIFHIPTTGLVAVRAGVETDSTTPVNRSHAFASGRSIVDTNPIGSDSSPAAWQTTTAFAPSASQATQATDGAHGVGVSGWVVLNVVPQIDDATGGGYVYVGTRLASNERGIVGNGSRPTSAWGDVVNALLPSVKYRQFHHSGADYVTTNQNAMPAKAADTYYSGSSWLDYVPIKRTIWGVNIGDSTSQALGDATAAQPYNYNWAHVAASDLISSGVAIHISNFGYEGRPVAYYLGDPGASTGRLSLMLADADFRPSFVVIQPFSINDTGFDQAKIDAGMKSAILMCKKLRELGIVPILRTVIPAASGVGAANTRRVTANNMIRASGEVVFDIDAIVSTAAGDAIKSEYTADGTHLNKLGNDTAARSLSHGFIKTLMRLMG